MRAISNSQPLKLTNFRGPGEKYQPIDAAKFVGAMKVWYVFQIEYPVAVFLAKMSILAFYQRLSPVSRLQLATKIVAGVVTVYTVTLVLLNVMFFATTLLVDSLFC